MTTTRKAILSFSILALGLLGRDAFAGGILVRHHDESLSATEREDLRNERLYEHVVELRAHDPEEFDRQHPVLGEFVSQRPSFEYWVNRWEADPAQFEHWHPRFWRIIDGGALEGGPPVSPPLVFPAVPVGEPRRDVDHSVSPHSPNPPGKPNSTIPVNPAPAVPEPSSLQLLLMTVELALAVRGGSRILQPVRR